MKRNKLIIPLTTLFIIISMTPLNTFADTTTGAGLETTGAGITYTFFDEGTKYVVTKNNVMLRADPEDDSVILTMIPKSTIVSVSMTDKIKWACVEYGGTSGWVLSRFVNDYTATGVGTKTMKIPYLSQLFPINAPVGCEGTSSLMALHYQGYAINVGLKQFLDWMPKDESNPAKGFVGSPYAPNKEIRTTIFPAKLTEYCNQFGVAEDISGADPIEIRREVQNGNPVVAYCTFNWEKPRWWDYNVEGVIQSFLRNNHVITVCGYDPQKNAYYIADPYNTGNPATPYFYWKDGVTFENSYNARRHAVVFLKKNPTVVVENILLDGLILEKPIAAINVDSRIMVSLLDFKGLLEKETENLNGEETILRHNGKTLQFSYGKSECLVDEKPVPIDKAPLSIDGEMYIPISAIIKEFHFSAAWSPKIKTLALTTPGQPAQGTQSSD